MGLRGSAAALVASLILGGLAGLACYLPESDGSHRVAAVVTATAAAPPVESTVPAGSSERRRWPLEARFEDEPFAGSRFSLA